MTEETVEAETTPAEGTEAESTAEQNSDGATEQSASDKQEGGKSEASEAELPAYEPDLKAPEGVEIADEARLTSLKESVVGLEGQIAEAAGDRGKIREIVNGFVNSQIQAEAERAANEAKSMNDTVEGWRKDSMKHPDFGGSKWPETEDKVAQVMTRFGSDELGDLMTRSGIGNHPTVVEFMLNVQGSIGEADPTGGAGAPSSESKTHAQRIYG